MEPKLPSLVNRWIPKELRLVHAMPAPSTYYAVLNCSSFFSSLSLGLLSLGFRMMGIRRNIFPDAFIVHVVTVNSAFIFECSKSVNLYYRESNVSTSCTCANDSKGQLGLMCICFSPRKAHSDGQEKDRSDSSFVHGPDVHLWPRL